MQLYYKYTRPKHFKSILVDGTLAFPKFSQLNDPFESSIESTIAYWRQDFRELTPREKRPGFIVRIGAMTFDVQDPAYDEARPKVEHNAKVKQHNAELEAKMKHIRWCRDNLGICSMTIDPENVVMWAHYAQNGRGACIGFDFSSKEFGTFVPSDLELRGHEHLFQPIPVVYATHRPPYKNQTPAEYVKDAFFTKYERWGYEQEVRLLRPTTQCSAVNDVPVLTVPRAVIAEVILGAACTPNDVADVRQIVKDLPTVTVKQAKIADGEYKLSLRDV